MTKKNMGKKPFQINFNVGKYAQVVKGLQVSMTQLSANVTTFDRYNKQKFWYILTCYFVLVALIPLTISLSVKATPSDHGRPQRRASAP